MIWLGQVVGKKRCPIVDTWWQTETGAIMITALPGAFPLKPGCATLPFFGVAPVLLDDKGKELKVVHVAHVQGAHVHFCSGCCEDGGGSQLR